MGATFAEVTMTNMLDEEKIKGKREKVREEDCCFRASGGNKRKGSLLF